MPLGIQGVTGSNSLFALNMLRLQGVGMQRNLAQLSSGQRIPFAFIDPSGLALSQGFRAQIGGTEQAIYNAQDTVNLARTAEATLGNQTEILGRMRDVSVRAANEATMTDADRARLNQEFQSLSAELTRAGEASTFNTKQLTSEANPFGTQAAQVGPNAGAENQIDVTVNPSTANTLGNEGIGEQVAAQDVTTAANARDAITAIDNALAEISTQRAGLGITENRLNYSVNDLSAQRINLAAANSRIADTDFAEAITENTKLGILGQMRVAILAQANAQPGAMLNLLGI
ncbi:MAG: flagellin [bacterium]